jgi:hypothetical protein
MATGQTKGSSTKAAAKAAGARTPQDHQAKKPVVPEGKLGATVRGKLWLVDEEALDDFELLDDLNALDQRSDPTRMPAVLRRLLQDQWSEAMDVLRDKDTGRVTVEAGSQFVFDLMEELNPNSSSS